MRFAILAGGLAALLVTGWGLTLGGGLALGRLDPAFSLPGQIVFAVALAFVMRGRTRREGLVAGLAMLGFSLALDTLLGTLLAARFAWDQAIVALFVQAAVWAAARAWLGYAVDRSPAVICAMLAVGAVALALPAAWLLPALYAPRSADDPTRIAILSGVPLEWRGPVEMRTILDDSAQLSPLLPALTVRFDTVRLDAIDAGSLKGIDVLMLAQPRGLSPAELVHIDRWVRSGGRVLILADPLLSWPADYPLGDRRNPPVTSLLTPLLGHWGLEFGRLAGEGGDVFIADGHRVDTTSTGRFRITGVGCTLSLDGRRADCTLGRGRAVVIADADMLNPALWSGGGHDAARWREGNIGWIIDEIRALASSPAREIFAPSWRLPSAVNTESTNFGGER